MTSPTPEPQTWISHLAETSRSIDSLVDEGFAGFSLQDLAPWLRDVSAMERITPIAWVRTVADEEGEVAVMTADSAGLNGLLAWMLEHRGQCPMVYAPDEEMEIPDAAPLLRPTAYNLPEGMSEEAVMSEEFLATLEELFAGMKEAYGNQAHLVRMDYGVFVEYALNHDTVMLTGEFVDLDSREIHTFTMDGLAQRMRYQSTGRTIWDGQEQAPS